MKTKLVICLIILLWHSALPAQYDERQILVQQANQHMVRREYKEAEAIFLSVLEKHPEDLNTVMQLTNMYLNISDDAKVSAHLKKYERLIPEKNLNEYRIQLLILQGKPEEAEALADSHLAVYGNNQSSYYVVASYFLRRAAYDRAISIYQKARAVHGTQIYSLEIANAAMQARNYSLALAEYLKHVQEAENTNLFVKNQIGAIVKEDSTLLSVLQDFSTEHSNNVIREIYANALLALSRNEEAFLAYKNMPLTYMRGFAAEQLKQGNIELALAANRHLAAHSEQEMQKISYGLEIAKILYQSAQFDSAGLEIERLLADPFWEASIKNTRSNLYIQIRRLKAENDLALGVDLNQIRQWLIDTRLFSSVYQETQQLDLELATISLLSKDYATAHSALQKVNLPNLTARRDYLFFINALMQGESEVADSLMNEYVLKHPTSGYTNDIFYLNMLFMGLNQQQRPVFTEAIRYLQLFDKRGIALLRELYDQTEESELLIIAIEWSFRFKDMLLAEELLQTEVEDELSAEYLARLRLELNNNRLDLEEMARAFLKNKPNSIFSPQFRQVISRAQVQDINM